MFKVKLVPTEYFDEDTNTFHTYPEKEVEFQIEHSLVSISKWESKWHKSFLSTDEKTPEELADYIKCMTLSSNVDPDVYKHIPEDEIKRIMEYISDPMTGTTFDEEEKKGPKKIITNELIYYLMVSYGIPFECQKWHLNRLLTLIRVCAVKNNGPRKMSEREVWERNKSLNKARRAKFKSRG